MLRGVNKGSMKTGQWRSHTAIKICNDGQAHVAEALGRTVGIDDDIVHLWLNASDDPSKDRYPGDSF
jgi:hypothetical protein